MALDSATARQSSIVRGTGLAGLHQPALVGDYDSLGAVAEAELGQDAADVGADRRLTEDEPLGDLGVGQPPRDEPQDVQLPVGELVQFGWPYRPGPWSTITLVSVERIPVDLSGIPETLLGNLGRRAAAARLGALTDPMAIEVVERLEYDFADSGRGARLHAVRVSTFDAAVRRFLGSHPAGTVVALGEGLETQFWRLDNGHVSWLTVDVPETMDLRHRVLPDGPRQSSHRGSALDLDWLDRLDPADPILVTAQGLFPYFQRAQVHDLIAGIAARLPGSLLVFDAVPEAMLSLVRRASGRERDLAVELWTWLFNSGERAAIQAIPRVEELRDLAPPLTFGVTPLGLAAIGLLPRRLRYSMPVFAILQARFRTTSVH